MDRRGGGERPPVWMWVCRKCGEEGFTEPPDICPNCDAEGDEAFEWFPLSDR